MPLSEDRYLLVAGNYFDPEERRVQYLDILSGSTEWVSLPDAPVNYARSVGAVIDGDFTACDSNLCFRYIYE